MQSSMQQPVQNILIVDDETLVARAAARALRSDMLAVHVASGPEAALEMLSRHRFDLVLSDFDMPVLDGVGLLDEVRRRHPRVCRVLMSADPPADLPERLRSGEIEHFEAKPFGGDLALRLGNLLSSRAPDLAIG